MLNMLQVRQTLSNKATELEGAVTQIRRLLSEMDGVMGTRCDDGEVSSPAIAPTQFADKPLGQAIREYLYLTKHPATKEQLQTALAAGGSNLGKYPKRAVANAVAFGVKNEHLEVRGELVYLLGKSSPPGQSSPNGGQDANNV
jgi:hypothetical protein